MGTRLSMLVVVKIGTSSVTLGNGGVDSQAVERLSGQVAEVRQLGHLVVVVTSGAVTAGVAALAPGASRPSDPVTLQALAAIGQHRLMRVYDDAFGAAGLLAGQVLLAPLDFAERRRYLHARETLSRLLELGVVPVVNENDAIADDEICFGDNDRLAALVAHLLRADLMILLTDLAGLFSADPRVDEGATLIDEVREIDHELELAAGGTTNEGARGGMASKLAAAKMAAWSGVRTIIAAADRPSVLVDAVTGQARPGTVFVPHEQRLPARKLWIAFALRPKGRIVVDEGAKTAVVERSTSLLPAGVTGVEGSFSVEDAVELVGPDGLVFAKGIASLASHGSAQWIGRQTSELPPGLSGEAVHRDDLVVLSSS
ncbi:MAG: glutamate 5-kinase [Acidimicrobiales bacterium]